MADFSQTNDPNYVPPTDLGRVRDKEGRITSTPANKYIFEPKEDISAFELSKLMPFLTGQQPLNGTALDKLSPMVTRHITVIEPEEDEGTERILE